MFIVSVFATPYGTGINWYGAAGSGAITFTSSFTADGGGWVGSAPCVYFINFNLNSGGTWSALGWYAQTGCTISVTAAPSGSVTMLITPSAVNNTVYVYMPDFTPSAVTNVDHWSYSAVTGLLTIGTMSTAQTVVISSGSSTVFRLLDVVTAAFAYFGLGDIGTNLFSVINTFTTYFIQAAATVILLITQIMTMIFFVSGSIIYWLTLLFSMLISLFTIVGDLMNGASTVGGVVLNFGNGVTSFWELFNWSVTAPFLVILAFIYWLDGLHKRSIKSGQSDIQIAIADIQMLSWVIGELWNWTFTVFNFVFNVIMSIISSLTGA